MGGGGAVDGGRLISSEAGRLAAQAGRPARLVLRTEKREPARPEVTWNGRRLPIDAGRPAGEGWLEVAVTVPADAVQTTNQFAASWGPERASYHIFLLQPGP